MIDITSNPALSVLYDPIVLKSHYTYRKKTLIEKFNISNQTKNVDKDSNKSMSGILIIDEANRQLFFKPYGFCVQNDLMYYQEDFLKKMAIPFNNIKSIIFVSKKNESIYVKSSESINKSYRNFVINCFDFRVYTYMRVGIQHKNDVIRYFQDLFRAVFESKLDRRRSMMWQNMNSAVILKVYHKTVTSKLKINLRVVENNLVIIPSHCRAIEGEQHFQFGPQVVYYSEFNNVYLAIVDRPIYKSYTKVLKDMAKAVGNFQFCEPTIFCLNKENLDSKFDMTFPTNKELNEAFEKLFLLCTPRSKAEFKRSDKKWLSKLSECGWLGLLNRCLQLTRMILNAMREPRNFVYMIENGCPTWGWLFGSLVQIICEPFVRTCDGFLYMIEKNWVLSGAFNNVAPCKPQLFLLFLDCVHQLLRCSPFLFEFNEEMLICLYDLFIIAPSGFMRSQDFEFKRFVWSQFFVDQVFECFQNRFFIREVDCCINIPKLNIGDFGGFWFKMYSRWIPYVQVENGSMSIRHYSMVSGINTDSVIYSNYPFSLNYDNITMDNEDNNDDTRSINTVISEE